MKTTKEQRIAIINEMIENLHKLYGNITWEVELQHHNHIEKKVDELNREFGTNYIYRGQKI